ncbi:MAG: hypothetical protein ACM3ML_38775 [Micromonosporaceae bacterium]
MTADSGTAVAEVFRQEWGRVAAALIGMTENWDLAEECAQDAFARWHRVRWHRVRPHRRGVGS